MVLVHRGSVRYSFLKSSCTKLILDVHGNNLDSYRISLESFRTFRGPLLLKPVAGQELFFSVSYNKPALAQKLLQKAVFRNFSFTFRFANRLFLQLRKHRKEQILPDLKKIFTFWYRNLSSSGGARMGGWKSLMALQLVRLHLSVWAT